MFKYVIASFCDKNKEEIFSYLIETYLSFRQPEVDSQFRLPPDGDVSVEMKLLLQLQPLMVCVNYPVFLLRSCFTCESDKKRNSVKIELFFFSSQVVELEDLRRGRCMPRPAYLHTASL